MFRESENVSAETTIAKENLTAIPEAFRSSENIHEGDTLRWQYSNGSWTVEKISTDTAESLLNNLQHRRDKLTETLEKGINQDE
ncbi:hypothetical protein [Haloprofundus salilacus]|uniref:hypothetical protein n=1 Tax=Haloprofundus salilacus TaxID=2876190 RepID=UPI001CCADB22|nr:hypothetical protein [Haloprofundus salilacus]